jgi:type IV fimbrial biogenesis protein FimT
MQRGLSVLELLVGLALLGVVATMAAPTFSGFVDSQRRHDTAQMLTSSLRQARAEAVLRNQPVTVQALGGDWSKGWRVVVSASPGQQAWVLNEHSGYRSVKVIGNSKVASRVGFDRAGRLLDNANGTLAVCRDDSHISHYQVVIAVTGRITLRDNGFASEPCA